MSSVGGFRLCSGGSEVAGLSRPEMDVAGRRWTIPGSRTKNKSPQVVPLAPLAFKIVKEGFEHTGTDQAFSGRKRQIASTGHALTRAFIRLREDVGAGDLTVHDLRWTGATMMAEIGIPGDIISRILNHTPPGPQVTKIYNRFDYEPQKRTALERWETHLMSIVRTKLTGNRMQPRTHVRAFQCHWERGARERAIRTLAALTRREGFKGDEGWKTAREFPSISFNERNRDDGRTGVLPSLR
jgi:hypothetical protein